MSKTDVFVIGGGPAGLAAAIAARLQGFDVTVADAACPPIDKACGEGLMPDSLAALHRLGVQFDTEQSFPFTGIRFHGAGVSVEADFPGGHGIGMRRPLLHQPLVDRAAELGVKLLWKTRVVSMDDVQARWIIGADGHNSRVRRAAGLDRTCRESLRYGFRRHYRVAPWTDRMEIYWGSGCQMYVTPVSPEEVCVVLLGRDPHVRFQVALPQFPELQQRLAAATAIGPERGAVTSTRRLRRVYRDRTVLIGDASGSVDAITGEGMCLSFRQAVALAEALAANDLAGYQLEHRRLAARPSMMAHMMLSLDRSLWLRQRVLRGMASEPKIFANLLAQHVGALSPIGFLFRGMLPLGREILTS